MSKVIGVVSPALLYENDNTNLDIYRFGNNYMKRIYACGGLPLGLLPCDARLNEEAFEHCDALLICGGKKIWPHHLQAVRHAEATGKKLLGICLGMQTINRYFKTVEYAEEHGFEGDLLELYDTPIPTMKTVEGHHNTMLRGHEDEIKHLVNLSVGSHLARLVGADHVYGATVHNHAVVNPSKHVTVTGYAEDGTIEVIERDETMIGTQFHPEVDEELLCLFDWLCK